jgi:hypothetical protein
VPQNALNHKKNMWHNSGHTNLGNIPLFFP